MTEYLILDENDMPVLLNRKDTIRKILDVLKTGKRKSNMIVLDEKAYEYFEIKLNSQTIRILKDVTSKYKLIKKVEALEDDIEVLKEENKVLKKDELTGLYRPDTAMKLIRSYILYAYETNTEFSLIMCDVDKFKSVNDTYGHEFGNTVLHAMGNTILSNVRTNVQMTLEERRQATKNSDLNYENTDIVVRYGGEEIVILMKNINLENTVKRIEEIRQKISELDINGIHVTMSFGIYHFVDRRYAPEITKDNSYMMERELLKIADQMMYYSKKNGRNKTCYYDSLTSDFVLVDGKEKEPTIMAA